MTRYELLVDTYRRAALIRGEPMSAAEISELALKLMNEDAQADAERRAVKTCPRCARLYTPERWVQLRFVGEQRDDTETLELRECACGSSIAIRVQP
jgi:hypothetical protein